VIFIKLFVILFYLPNETYICVSKLTLFLNQMKFPIHKLVLLLVGGLFIFSGLIKLNDPIGTQIKLEEYFEVFAEDFKDKPDAVTINGQTQVSQTPATDTLVSKFFMALVPFALWFSVALSSLEVIWGVNLLVGYRPKFSVIMLLLMILFFTVLTFYSWYFNKVTDCGCFGDAIKLTPLQSFIKDIVLTAMLVFLFIKRNSLQGIANISKNVAFASNLFATVASIGLGLYAINFLPPIDFLPYKVGNNIPKLMLPADSIRYEDKYIFTNLKTKKDEEFKKWEDKLNDSTLYKYKSYDKKTLNPEALPKIGADFSVMEEGKTKELFKGNKLLIVVPVPKKSDYKSFADISTLINALKGSNVVVWGLSSDKATFEALRHEYQLPIEHYSMDTKVLKTMMRSNPGIILLQNGTVKAKWHYNQTPTAEAVKKFL
jgi:uncharacterized membrane protein YphA (DoxX/SURF4 family)